MDQNIEEALQYIDPNIPRDDWVRVGMAIKNEYGEDGFSLFDQWSQGGESYKRADTLSTWKSLSPAGGINIGTLYFMAKEHGFNPLKKMAEDEQQRLQDKRQREKERLQKEHLEAEQKKREGQESVALAANERWQQAEPADPAHPYLKRKGVEPHGIRQEGELLLMPLFNERGRLWNLQTINPVGEKRFLTGGRKQGLYFPILGEKPGVVICEGFATGATLAEATGYMAAVALDCGNLMPVSKVLREKHPEVQILIAADNDRETKDNPGVTKATAAAEAIDARVVVPDFPEEVNGTDFNDLAGHLTREEIAAYVEEDHSPPSKYPFILFGEVEPSLDTTALIQDILLPESFVVTYGESGSGKTFDALYRDLSIASGSPYHGHAVEQGLVVYLAAEGGVSTRNRVAAYREHLFPKADFVLVPYSMDLLSPKGDVEGLIGLIKRLEDLCGKKCVKVTQDTLARAMQGGNENASEDMGRLVSHADRIRHQLACLFEFIHHAGKDTARGARGHSSLKAATDTEIEVSVQHKVHSVKPTKQRDLEVGLEFAFTLRQVELGHDKKGNPVTTCIPETSEAPTGKKPVRLSDGQKLAISTLEEAMRLHQRQPPREILMEPSNRLNGTRNVCPVEAWRQIYIARKSTDRTKPDSARRSLDRHIEKLQAIEVIKVYGEWVWFLEG